MKLEITFIPSTFKHGFTMADIYWVFETFIMVYTFTEAERGKRVYFAVRWTRSADGAKIKAGGL